MLTTYDLITLALMIIAVLLFPVICGKKNTWLRWSLAIVFLLLCLYGIYYCQTEKKKMIKEIIHEIIIEWGHK